MGDAEFVEVDNAPFVPWISPTPLLMIVALGDEVTPPDLSLDAYSKAKEPKKLVLLPGNHFAPYSEEIRARSLVMKPVIGSLGILS